jgi:hypothetical protein
MKTLILGLMLAVTAVSGVVVASQTAEAGGKKPVVPSGNVQGR